MADQGACSRCENARKQLQEPPKMVFISIKGDMLVIYGTVQRKGIAKLVDVLCNEYGIILDKKFESLCG